MSRVWVTGDAVVDLIPDSSNTLLKCPGGAPANVAVAISRLGGNAAFFGRIGNDPFGHFMAMTLSDEQVDTHYLVKDDNQRTSTVLVDLDEDGERTFTFMVKPSADQFTQVKDIPEFTAGEWLHVCSIALANEPSRSSTLTALKKVKAAGGYISFDPNLRDEVWNNPAEIKSVVLDAIQLADVVKFSEEELAFLTDTNSIAEGLDVIGSFGNKLVLVTQGAKGVLIDVDGVRELVSGTAVKPVDTTGAGDAFVGGLLAKLSQTSEWQSTSTIQAAIMWANACGALATTQKGAMSALPTEKELSDFINNTP
ncbi:aminoimidazole riboside kinase [Photobacterium indicum]|uniref:Aminoimidazole riboside kinase n=1 Tax=Photobacterium indicum TaxID=81447 RepID=A0A2T3LBF8_9GAMM|nr:aminoimidazole riboside kinase [Photobacterium indicum]PSV48653.1 aminoimidazole riboside kinase [Photobacterium indicum]